MVALLACPLLRNLDVTYVTVAHAYLLLYFEHQVPMHVWQTWSCDKLETSWVPQQTLDALNLEGEKTMADRTANWKAQASTLLDVRIVLLVMNMESHIYWFQTLSSDSACSQDQLIW